MQSIFNYFQKEVATISLHCDSNPIICYSSDYMSSDTDWFKPKSSVKCVVVGLVLGVKMK